MAPEMQPSSSQDDPGAMMSAVSLNAGTTSNINGAE